MISVSEQELEADLSNLNRRIGDYVIKLHIGGAAVVRRQSGLLAETMMKIAPRAEPKDIKEDVLSKFKSLSSPQLAESRGPRSGNSDVNWYAFTSTGLYGLADTYDLTNATEDGLYQIYFNTSLTNQGFITAGRRGRQTVYLRQQITTKAATVRKLILRLQRHSGRLRASFVVAWQALRALGFRSSFAMPKYILDNANGAKGSLASGLSDKADPSFTLISHAIGSGSDEMKRLVRYACQIRAKAMEKRLAFLLKYPEKVSEEQ